MEYQKHPGEPRPAVTHNQHWQEPKSKKWRKLILILLLVVVAAAAAYYWRDKDAKDSAKKQQSEVASLQGQITTLRKELSDAKAQLAETKKPETKAPSQTTLDNIEAAVKSGNYAALQGYMASKVRVIIAASEGLGDRTPTQAVTDLKYLDTGTDPWDFSLLETTLKDYKTGDYEQYFPDTAFVGKSANNYVVSFTFDDNGKINGIFMAASAGLL